MQRFLKLNQKPAFYISNWTDSLFIGQKWGIFVIRVWPKIIINCVCKQIMNHAVKGTFQKETFFAKWTLMGYTLDIFRFYLNLIQRFLVNFLTGCCVFWPANACLCMHLHGWKWWKTLGNSWKSSFSSGLYEAYTRIM